MYIEGISLKALRRFSLAGHPKGPRDDVEQLRAMPTFIVTAISLDELARSPKDGLHRLTESWADTWSMTVTRNRRLTFRVTQTGGVPHMNLEDYPGS